MANALLIRLNEIFILRLGELWGEIFLLKALGFALVVLFVWAAHRKLRGLANAPCDYQNRYTSQNTILTVITNPAMPAAIHLPFSLRVESSVVHRTASKTT